MKNFLLFSLLVVASTVWGQEVPSGNNFTEITNNYKAELGTGNFVYAVPLFDVATASPDFNFSGSMYYNAQAASSVYTTEGILSKGWSVDFLPSIYRNIDKDDTLWDESYYMPNTADVYGDGTPFDRPDRVNDLFEFSAFGLKGSFRLVYNSNNTIDVNIVDSNAYIEIIPDATMSSGNGDGKNIDLLGFTIKDKNGFSYNFNSVETSAIMIGISSSSSSYQAIADLAGIDSNGYNLYKRAFLLGSVTDKYSRELVQFVYKTYPWSASYLNKTVSYDQKVIDKVVFPNTGSLVFNTIQSKINSIILQDFDNQQLSKVTFSTSSVNFYDKNNVLEEHYGFTYNSTLNTNKDKTNNYGNYLNTEDCFDPSTLYNNEIQRYDAGLLKTITLPHKGKVNIEYEVNTFSTTTPSESYTNKNERNYNYVPVPVTNNPFTKKYSFYLEQITNYTNEGYYVKYDSQLYTSPLLDENGQPFKMYPYLEIRTGSNNYLFQNFLYEKQCTKGEEIYHVGLYTSPLVNSTVYLNPLSGYESYISNVQVFKKTLKPEEERVKFLYGPSVRVKKITVTGITNEIISETDYSYQDPEDDKKSSGFSPEILWDSFGNRRVATYKPFPIFYKYVTISETGKGKTVYELNSGQFQNNKLGIPEVAFHPKSIRKYTADNQLTEEIVNDFEYFKVSADPTARNKFKKINSVIKTYEGTAFKTTSTEKLFDTNSLLPVSNKIVEAGSGDMFNEQYTHQKLGNAFYRTAVEKNKNNAALNKSTFTYQQQGSTQAYNLYQTKVAKEARPLEVEKEITRYDDYGNILEYKTKDGLVVSQIWGYNNSKLVAELKNVAYTSIAAATITAIKTNSNAATYNETTLLTSLNGLRTTHSAGFVTTYTYKPLVGITSLTDANGRKETYQYDSANRLYRVLNHEGLVIKEYTYNIKN